MQELVPVKLSLGSSQGVSQDWLLWPAAATEEVPEFAAGLVRDLGVPPQYQRPVAESILAQVADWRATVPPPPPPGPQPRRELLRLDVVLGGGLRLRDRLLWDLHAAHPTPEEFAAELCADCGVEPQHGAAVAAAIRIELGKLRCAPASNLPLPTPRIFESEAARAAAANVAAAAPLQAVCTRAPQEWQEWGPSLHQLSVDEVRALQKEHVLARALQQRALQQRLHEQQEAAAKQQALAQQAAQLAHKQALAQQQPEQRQQQAPGSADAAAAPGHSPPEQQQHQHQHQHQQAAGGLRKRGLEGGESAPRRALRPRRATRLAAILKEEEEPSDSEGSNPEGSRVDAGGRWAASTGSGGYQPDEASLQAEETEAAAVQRPAKGRGGAQAKKAATARQQQQRQQQQRQQQQQQQQQQGRRQLAATPPRPGLAAYQQAKAPPAAKAGPAGANGDALGAPYGSSRVLSPPQMGAEPGAGQQAQVPQAQVQHVQMVGAAIVHYARELGIGEQKIQSFLAKSAAEQLTLYRTLHQLVQQARARQQEQLQAAVVAQQAQQAPNGLQLPPGGGAAPTALPVLPLPPQERLMQPPIGSKFANLFSEMFD